MRLFFLFFTLLLSGALCAQNLNDKLEAFFSFSKCKAVDESGNGSSGALIGNDSCVCGVRDSTIRFDSTGVAIYFVGPLSDVFTTSDFTLSFYIKPRILPKAQGASQVLFTKQENCSDKRGFWVRYNPKTQKISSGISQDDVLFATVTASLDNGVCWQFITITRANTVYSLYVNGVLKDAASSLSRIDLSTNGVLKAGEPLCLLDKPYQGDMDEIRVYSKALTPDEIATINLRPDKILNDPDPLVYLGNDLQITTSETCAQNFAWSPTAGVSDAASANPVIEPTITTTYQIKFSYDDGCVASDTIHIRVIDPDTLDCNKVFIPNAFVPGSVREPNRVFQISNPYSVNDFISFEVFDRWGGRVFNATTPQDTWDGTFQGQPLNAGVFLYRLRYRCDGEEKVKAGSLTLLR